MHQKERQYQTERAAFERAWERQKTAVEQVDAAELAALGGPRASRATGSAAEKESHRRQQRIRQASQQAQQWKRAHSERTRQLLESAKAGINPSAAAPSQTVRVEQSAQIPLKQEEDGAYVRKMSARHVEFARRRCQALQMQQEANMSSTKQKYKMAWKIYGPMMLHPALAFAQNTFASRIVCGPEFPTLCSVLKMQLHRRQMRSREKTFSREKSSRTDGYLFTTHSGPVSSRQSKRPLPFLTGPRFPEKVHYRTTRPEKAMIYG